MLTQAIGSEHLNLLRVDKGSQCITQCEQECLQALPALALGDVFKDRDNRPAPWVSDLGQVKLDSAVKWAYVVLKANRLAA